MRSIITENVPPRRIRVQIGHHSFRPSARQFRGRRTLVAIRRYHMRRPPNGCGWIDVGYNGALFGPDGSIWTGRPLSRGGAHTIGHNMDGIGSCLLINGNKEQPRDFPEMMESYYGVLTAYCQTYGMGEHDIHPHSDFSTKTCPGRLVSIPAIREVVGDRLGLHRPKYVRLKLSDGSRYNWVEGLPLVNTSGTTVAADPCAIPLNGRVHLAAGDSVREALESHGWEIAAWRAAQGARGTIYSRPKRDD